MGHKGNPGFVGAKRAVGLLHPHRFRPLEYMKWRRHGPKRGRGTVPRGVGRFQNLQVINIDTGALVLGLGVGVLRALGAFL